MELSEWEIFEYIFCASTHASLLSKRVTNVPIVSTQETRQNYRLSQSDAPDTICSMQYTSQAAIIPNLTHTKTNEP